MKEILNNNEKGITLIALVITIIVLLILAGVAIAMLSGENGILTRTKESTFKTDISSIQEALRLKKTEILANNEGNTPLTGYDISFDSLQIDSKVRDEYKGKLKIGRDGNLYYDGTKVTDTTERSNLEAEGISEYTKERVSFTNYIENNGNNYYINGDPKSDYYKVATFSSLSKTFTVYDIQNGEIIDTDPKSFEVIDKNNVPYTEEQIIQATGVDSIDDIGDDTMLWDEVAYVIFKENYTQAMITTDWYTLNTNYTLP